MKPFPLLIKPASADSNLRCKNCFYLDHRCQGKSTRMSDFHCRECPRPLFCQGDSQKIRPGLKNERLSNLCPGLKKFYAIPKLRSIADEIKMNQMR